MNVYLPIPYNTGDLGSIPGSGRSPGEGNGNPLQYSCLENPRMEEPGGLQSMGSQRVGHGVAKSRARLSDFTLPGINNLLYLLNNLKYLSLLISMIYTNTYITNNHYQFRK